MLARQNFAGKFCAGRAIFERETFLGTHATRSVEFSRRLRHGWPMNNPISLDDAPACHMGSERKELEPCSIVIFGASGDLTARKLIPGVLSSLQGKADAVRVPHHWFCAARKDGRIVARGIARRARPVFPHQAGGRKGLARVRGQACFIARATSPTRRLTKSWKNC